MTNTVPGEFDNRLTFLHERILEMRKYCSFSFDVRLAGVGIEFFADNPSWFDELQQYLPQNGAGNVRRSFEVFIFKSEAIFEACQGSIVGGDKVYSKCDQSYSMKSNGTIRLLMSNPEFFELQHCVMFCAPSLVFLILPERFGHSDLRLVVRLTREIVLRHNENCGAILAHAAAFAYRSLPKGVLLMGGKGSGKTTVLWNALMSGAANYLANDRCILKRESDVLMAFAWPLSVRLGYGTLEATSRSWSGLRRAPHMRKGNDIERLKWGSREKVEMTPAEMVSITRCEYIPASTIDAVIFPSLSLDGRQPSISRVDTNLIGDLSRDDLCLSHSHDFLEGWLGVREISSGDLLVCAAQLQHHLSTVPSFILDGDARRREDIAKILLDFAEVLQ